MFTISVIQNKFDKGYEKLEKFLNKEFPHNEVAGIFGYENAPIMINFYGKMTGEPPSIGIFILDVNQDEGVSISLIKTIKKSHVLKKNSGCSIF